MGKHPVAFQKQYPWLVLAGCCLVQGGIGGLVINTTGQFLRPISLDLSCSITAVSAYRTVGHLASCALLPFTGRILYRFGAGKSMSLSVLLFSASTWGMSRAASIGEIYVMALFQGIGSALLLMTSTPIILDNWFESRKGLAFGISSAAAGVVGTVMNPVFAAGISRWGWRSAMAVSAAVSLAAALPATALLLRLRPSDLQMRPYGASVRTSEEAPAVRLEGRSRRVWIKTSILALASALMLVQGFSGHVANHVSETALHPGTAPLAASMVYVGSTLGKLSLGAVSDRFGLSAAASLGITAPALGFLCFLAPRDALLMAGGLLFGVVMGTSAAVIPLITRRFFSGVEYSNVFSVITMISMLVNALGNVAIGSVFDRFGSYRPALAAGAALLFLCQLIFFAAVGKSGLDAVNPRS